MSWSKLVVLCLVILMAAARIANELANIALEVSP